MSYPARLADAVGRYGPLCVGLDPRVEMLPAGLRPGPSPAESAAAVERFCLRVLDLVAPYAGVVKPQSAFFERLGPPGMSALANVLTAAKSRGFITILDAKRGDIASTATAYADAVFGGPFGADALTVNPYLGHDAVTPFTDAATANDCGLFVLVRTSNPGAGRFQDLVCDGRPLYTHVADAVAGWNAPTMDASVGYGSVGAVAGATHPRELAELRARLPGVWLLVPGYGAQGGSASDIRAAYDSRGLGAVVNSSRGVTFPFDPSDARWEAKISAAAARAQAELRGA